MKFHLTTILRNEDGGPAKGLIFTSAAARKSISPQISADKVQIARIT